MTYRNWTNDFWQDESGAVTVDYVVLTGAVTGMGIAASTTLSGGVDTLANNIAEALTGAANDVVEVLMSNDFTGGNRGNWTGGTVMNFRNFGELLALGPGETATINLGFPQGVEAGVITFDAIAGDSIDWESAFFYVDGQLVADLTAGAIVDGQEIVDGERGSFNWVSGTGENSSERGIQMQDYSREGITVSYETVATNEDLGAETQWKDEVVRVTVRIDNPPETMHFAASSNTDQPVQDEFWGIDNFEVGYQ